MYCIFDTETTGLPTQGLSPNQPNYPRVLQLACVLLDEKFVERGAFSTLIKLPDHTIVSSGAQNVHGISKEMCQKYGMDCEHALAVLQDYLDKAVVHVAHNLKFDYERIKQEFQLTFQFNDFLLTNPFCTMEATTDICKLPAKFPGTKYKWPKLSESYFFFFKEKLTNAHDALVDCRACGRIFKHLVENKLANFNL